MLENIGSAKIILDKNLNSKTLSEEITKMIKDPNKLIQMGLKANKIETQNVEEKIYVEL